MESDFFIMAHLKEKNLFIFLKNVKRLLVFVLFVEL